MSIQIPIELNFLNSQFIQKFKSTFQNHDKIKSVQALKNILNPLCGEFNISFETLRKMLTKEGIIEYKKESPRGYFLNSDNLEQFLNKSKTQIKYPIYFYKDFINGLVRAFSERDIVPTQAELKKVIESIGLPPKWNFGAVKKELSDKGIIQYSRTAPRGYFLNLDNLKAITESLPNHFYLTNENELITENGTADLTADLNSAISGQESGKSETVQETSTTVKESIGSEQIVSRNKSVSDKAGGAEADKRQLRESDKSSETIKSESQNILETIPRFPRYLIERMPKTAQAVINMGILEINKLSIKDLERYTDALANSRMFFSEDYENERELLRYIDEKSRYMSERLDELHNRAAEKMINKYIISKIKDGKFDKIINNLKDNYDYENAAWSLIEKLGKKARKIPLNEYALRKRIAQILRELFPNPNTSNKD